MTDHEADHQDLVSTALECRQSFRRVKYLCDELRVKLRADLKFSCEEAISAEEVLQSHIGDLIGIIEINK